MQADRFASTIQSDLLLQGVNQIANLGTDSLFGLIDTNLSAIRSAGDDECHADYVPPTHITTPAPSTPAKAPVRKGIANGTNENCAQYHNVKTGDFCNQIMVKHSVSPEDFLFLNQGVNKNCTNLFAEESYCVSPVGPINLYPGHPDYEPPTSTKPEIPWSELPKATYTPPAITGLPTYLPLAKKTRQDCVIYMDGSALQRNLDWRDEESVCAALASDWGISLEEMGNWNPSLNVSSSDCAASKEYQYCMAAYIKEYTPPSEPEPTSTATSSTVESPAEPSETQLPIRDGAAKDCKKYYDVVPPQTCEEVLEENDLTIAQFYKMNPAVGAECHNLWPNCRYCVKI